MTLEDGYIGGLPTAPVTPEPSPVGDLYCPRSCHRDRKYSTWEDLKKHVLLQHPDHDPFWFETYPETT